MSEENSKDKRKHPRLTTVCPCIMKGHSKEHHGLLRNVSIGGASVELNNMLPEKDNYELEFTLQDGPQVKVLSKISWSMPQGNAFIYGFEFINLGFFKRLGLNSYINKYMKIQLAKQTKKSAEGNK